MKRLGKLSNPRHEKFCQLLAQGWKHADAYRAAGFVVKDRRVATVNGSRLAARPEVRERLTELQRALREGATEDAGVTRTSVIEGLLLNIKQTAQKGQLAAVNRAYELLGKELGMFVERHAYESLDQTLDGKTPEELGWKPRLIWYRRSGILRSQLRFFSLLNFFPVW